MKIVVVASEAVPFAKTGGLADVAGALPMALERLGHHATLFLPNYRQARRCGLVLRDTGATVRVSLGARRIEGGVFTTTLPNSGVTAFLLDQPEFFDRDGLYQDDGRDYPDNAERFAFFGKAVVEAIRELDLQPDIVHCNDWQTGLIPPLLEAPSPLDPTGTLLTVHNLAYQGAFERATLELSALTTVPTSRFLDRTGRFSFLRAGLSCADLLNTVSPTYAQEIQTPEFGGGLDGLLRERREDLRGIINGIDSVAWNPSTDPFLAMRYDHRDWAEGKAACKADLQRRAGLPVRSDVTLVAQVGRLVKDKGWDLAAVAVERLTRDDVQWVFLGEGEPRYRQLLTALQDRHEGKVRAFLEFSDALAHQVEAGSDLILMPSLHEPCGLNQLYGLAYGAVPVVRATGGLVDTVVDATPWSLANETATGFAFEEPTPEALLGAIDRALSLRTDRAAWNLLVRTGMTTDWSWDRGARDYLELYEEIRRRRSSRVAG